MPSSTLQLIQASEPKYMGQILATLAVSLGPFAAGLGKGYSSPALASLQSLNAVHQHHHQHQRGHWGGGGGNSSAPIRAMAGGGFSVSNQEGSWIASLSLLGALFGGPLGGVAMRYGRKRTLLAVAIPFSFFWLLTVFANSVAMMYVTAFGCGFCSAIVLLVSHVYISEIASPEIRGGLCALAKMASHVGLLVSFSLGAYLDWRRLAMVVTAAPLTLLIAAFYVPETPSCLSLRGREDEAAESLQWLRGEETDVRQEWNTIQANVRKQKAPCSLSSALSSTSSGAAAAAAAVAAVTSDGLPSLIKTGTPLWKQKRLLRPVLTTCGVMLFHRMSGAHAFNFYAVPIFRASFAGMDPHGAAVIVAFVQLLASITSGLLVDTIGRLPLLIASNLFMTLALAAFGTFIYMEGGSLVHSIASAGLQSNANSQLDWIPLVCVLIFTVAFSIGVGPIAWLLISELYPLEYRGVGGAITSCFSYACAFVSVKTFVDLESAFGLHGAFWIYAIVSLLGLAFVLVFVPETRIEFNMKLFIIAAVLAVAAAAPSSYKTEEKKYEKDYKYPEIVVTSQSDERNLDGSSQWNYAQSDYATRAESQAQKKFTVTKVDDYGKETKEEVYGNTNQGSSYWVSPEGEKFTLTWVADDAGFQPKGDHLPVAPVHVYELPVAPVHEYELPVAPVHEYELPVAPVHIPFNGKGYKIY